MSFQPSTNALILGNDDTAQPLADDERFYSVTTILNALDRPALLYWAAEEAAKCAVKNRTSLGPRLKAEGAEALIKWIRDAMYRKIPGQRTAADLGTDVHAACEEYGLTGIKPIVDEEVQPFLDQFDAWCQKWQPIYHMVEAAVYNRTFGHAGTLDAVAEIEGQLLMIDYKTSRKSFDGRPTKANPKGKPTGPYPETALQLAAYSHAELVAVWRARRFEKQRRRYYLLNTDEVLLGEPLPKTDGGAVIHITPEHCNLHILRCDDEVFEKFLHLQEVFAFTQDMAKAVVGPALERN
jgi:hypothetical protein